LCSRCVAERFARDSGWCAFLRPTRKFLRVACFPQFEQKRVPHPLLLPGKRTVVCYNPNPRGTHGHTRTVEGCKGQSGIRVRPVGSGCFCPIGDRLKFNQAYRDTPKDVSIRSEENQSGAKGTMGEAQLGSAGCCETQTVCLSSVEKENGSRATGEVGEGQSRAEELMTTHRTVAILWLTRP
jgi:hypothetical protein